MYIINDGDPNKGNKMKKEAQNYDIVRDMMQEYYTNIRRQNTGKKFIFIFITNTGKQNNGASKHSSTLQ